MGVLKHALCGLLALCLLLLAVRLCPKPTLASRIALSTVFTDQHGQTLRITLARDGQVRLFTPLAQIPTPLVQAVLLHEDQYFYRHPGINPVALVRAAFSSAGGTRLGASTLTMQLARLLGGQRTRSVGGKLRQMAQALWLSAAYSKHEVLEAYLNLAPYGGNVQGVGAAAALLFGKPLAALELPEILALAVLPQAPNARALKGQESPSLRAARLRLYARWQALHPASAQQAAQMASPLALSGSGLPFLAPHFINGLLQDGVQPDAQGRVATTLDARLQRLLERRLAQHLAATARLGVNNASVLLVDTRSMGIAALIGSAQYGNAALQGQVDGTRARRSPGSTLKPLLYALAFDQGLAHPQTVLKDAPTSFGAYAPENADGRFVGPITAQDALIRSRNIPAVQLAAQLSNPTLYQFLKQAQVGLSKSERHYGLALTLGGGEVTPRELARLYATLANHGLWRPLRSLASQPRLPGERLLSADASVMVLDILKTNPRPDDAIWHPARAPLTPAWKTGTSWGFRDAWTAGTLGPYVLVVWMGNFDGSANPALVGIKTAAPLFFDLADALKTAYPQLQTPLQPAPPRLAKVAVCVGSGALPNADCPATVLTWYIPGVSPIALSTLHRRVRIDTRSGLLACPDTPPAFVQQQVFEFWPSDLMRLFSQAGLPRRPPPRAGPCATGLAATAPPQILSPSAGVDYVIAAEALGQQVIPLNAHADAATPLLYWFAGKAYLGASAPGVALAWRPDRAGEVRLSVRDALGGVSERLLRIRVEE